MNKKQIAIGMSVLSFLVIVLPKLHASEPPTYLFNDSSNPSLGRLYKFEKPLALDHQMFASSAELAIYLQKKMDARSSEYHAQEIRFQDEQSKKALLATGTKHLQYQSEDLVLGIGIDGKGYNLYGKILMLLREKMRNEQNVVRAKL